MVAVPEKSSSRYQIDDLTLDIDRRSVTRNGKDLKIGGFTFELLLALIETAPAVASYDYLVERVWSGRETSPGTIAQRAKMLRAALEDDAASPRYFELIRGQGYRMVADVHECPDSLSQRPSRRWATVALVLVSLAAAFLIARFYAVERAITSSVAVLPFEDLSELSDQQYLADGIAEELINELTRLERLDVASRSESFNYRGPTVDLKAIGADLKVATVVEGSIRKSGDDLRVTVQLVEVDSGFHLWSQNFSSNTDDIFDIQKTIAESVAGALGVKLGVGGSNEFRGAGTRNFDAYQAFLRRDFDKAIELDPQYAAAWSRKGLSLAYTVWSKLPEQAPQILEQAYPYVEKARQLDPDSAQVHADFAAVSFARLQWNDAEASYARALAIRRHPDIVTSYGNMMTWVGRTRTAEALYKEADRLRGTRWSLMSAAMLYRSNMHIALKQVEAAQHQTTLMYTEVALFNDLTIALNFGTAEEVRLAIEALPQGTPDYSMLYAPLVELLDTPEAAVEFLLELADDPTRAWSYKYETIALLLAYYEEPNAAFEVFMNELPYTTVRYGALWFPVMAEVRQLPEFKQFVTDIGLVDYWQEHGWTNFCRHVDDADFVCD